MESHESLRKAAAELPHSKIARKQKCQQDAGGTVRRRDDIQELLYARSNSLSRKKWMEKGTSEIAG
jgi:hypothetical protein